MDTREGNLAPISEGLAKELKRKDVSGIFQVGQEVEVNGSKFVVHAIRPKKLILKILPR